jgi:hypothetical protein
MLAEKGPLEAAQQFSTARDDFLSVQLACCDEAVAKVLGL